MSIWITEIESEFNWRLDQIKEEINALGDKSIKGISNEHMEEVSGTTALVCT